MRIKEQNSLNTDLDENLSKASKIIEEELKSQDDKDEGNNS